MTASESTRFAHTTDGGDKNACLLYNESRTLRYPPSLWEPFEAPDGSTKSSTLTGEEAKIKSFAGIKPRPVAASWRRNNSSIDSTGM